MQVKYIYAEKVLISLNFTASQTVANQMHLYRRWAHSGAAPAGLPETRLPSKVVVLPASAPGEFRAEGRGGKGGR